MRSGFQRDPAPRNLAEHLLESFWCRSQLLFQDDFARFIQDTVTAGSISQIQTNRELVLFENLESPRSPQCYSSSLPVSFLRLERVVHSGAYRIPLETGLLIPSD